MPTLMRFALLFIVMHSAFTFASPRMVIIPIINADPQMLLPIIEQQLSQDSSVSIYQQQIILNAEPNEIEKITTLIKTLDQAGKQLRISIKNNDSSQNQLAGIAVNGNDSPNITITKNGKLTTTTTTIRKANTQHTNNSQQGIRVTEGQSSFIQTGSMMRYNTPSYNNNGQITHNQEWQSAQSGFYATTWLNGDAVSITIEQQNQAFTNDNTISTQSLKTHINGRLGEWIPLAGINNSKKSYTRYINGQEQNNENSNIMLYIKVELAE